MSEYTFEVVSTRPTVPPPHSRLTPYTALIEAVLETLGKGNAIALEPKKTDNVQELRYKLTAKVQSRAKHDARGLRARGVVSGGKVHLWVELKSGDKTAAPPAAAAVPDESTALEARIVSALRLNPQGFGHAEIVRAIFGVQATRPESQRQTGAALAAMSKAKLLMQDGNLLYTLTKAGRA